MRARTAGGLLLAGLILPLGACSSMPDKLDPTTWFGPGTPASTTPSPLASSAPIDTNQPFPNLSSVPEPPRPTLDPGQRMALMRGLESDRQTSGRQDSTIRQGLSTIPTSTEDYGAVRTPATTEPPPAGYDASSPEPALRAPSVGVALPAPAPTYAAEPPPSRNALAMPPAMTAPVAAPPPVVPAPAAATSSQAGARFAITPRPPISPPAPLSTQPGYGAS